MRLTSSRGFSLVELLVALIAGLIIVAAAGTLYVSILRANAASVQLSALNLGMQSLMDIMERDIRRAGYFASAAQNLARTSAGTPVLAPSDRTAMFSLNVSAGSTTLQDMQRIAVTAPLYDCILLRYDASDINDDANDEANSNGDGGEIAGNDEIMGYRFVSAEKGLEFKQWTTVATQLSELCDGDTGWGNISQDGQLQLTSLTFAITPETGFASPSGQRSIIMTLVGRSQHKPALTLSLQRQVRIRNDQY